jgi:hypothetical protein
MVNHSTCADHIALLAPVPKEHLADGITTTMTKGKVAFGSRAYDVFVKLEQERGGKPVDVYIYESYGNGAYDFHVSWHARYLGYVGAVNGAHPNGMRFRPASTAKYPGDNEGGDWLLFWEVDLLEEIPEAERMHVGEFVPYGKVKPYGNSFAPRGPMLVNRQ